MKILNKTLFATALLLPALAHSASLQELQRDQGNKFEDISYTSFAIEYSMIEDTEGVGLHASKLLNDYIFAEIGYDAIESEYSSNENRRMVGSIGARLPVMFLDDLTDIYGKVSFESNDYTITKLDDNDETVTHEDTFNFTTFEAGYITDIINENIFMKLYGSYTTEESFDSQVSYGVELNYHMTRGFSMSAEYANKLGYEGVILGAKYSW